MMHSRQAFARSLGTGLIVAMFAATPVAFADGGHSAGFYAGAGFLYGKQAFEMNDVEDAMNDSIRDEVNAEIAAIVGPNGDPSSLASAFEPPDTRVDVDDSLGLDVRAGYRFGESLAVELNFNFYNEFTLKRGEITLNERFTLAKADPNDFSPEFGAPGNQLDPLNENANIYTDQIAARVRNLNSDIRMYSIMAALKWYAFQLPPQLHPYVAGGVGALIADSDVSGDGSGAVDFRGGNTTDVSVTGRIGGGFDFVIVEDLLFNVEVSWALTTEMDLGLIKDARANTVPITFGLQYNIN